MIPESCTRRYFCHALFDFVSDTTVFNCRNTRFSSFTSLSSPRAVCSLSKRMVHIPAATVGRPDPVLYAVDTGEPLLTDSSVAHIVSVIADHGSDSWWELDDDDMIFVADEYKQNGKRGATTKVAVSVCLMGPILNIGFVLRGPQGESTVVAQTRWTCGSTVDRPGRS